MRASPRLLPVAPIAVLAVLGACSSYEPAPSHDDAGLASKEGTRVLLRTDLDPSSQAVVLDRLERIEKVLAEKDAWLPSSKEPVKVLVLGDEGTFRSIARSHGVNDPGTSAFACTAGEVVIRYRPEEWGQGPHEGWFLAPRSAPVSEALFRQRLEATFGGKLERTRLEDGCARAFVEQAARELGETPEAARRSRDDLLDAFLPLFLGAERALARTATASGNNASERGPKKSARVAGAPGLNYAVGRFLMESDGGKRMPVLRALFEHAAGAPVGSSSVSDSKDKEFEAARTRLDEDEDIFERWLRDQTVSALFDALENEPVPAARWEARSALQLLAGMDLDDAQAAGPDERARRIARARVEAKKIRAVRFTEEFDGKLLGARRTHGNMKDIVSEAKRELDRRAKGYGHPALEDGRLKLGQHLEERLRELSAQK